MNHSILIKTRIDRIRRAGLGAVVFCSLAEMLAAGQGGAGRPSDGSAEMQTTESAEARQSASIAGMAEALAKQRASIRRQVGAAEAVGFFELPPPVRMARSSSAGNAVANCEPLPSDQVDTLIERAAKREQIEPELVRGVIRQESAFYPCAVSPMGAKGLMQLMPATASQFNVNDPFDAESNVNAGAKLLKLLLDRYHGSVMKALSAYNAGTVPVDAASGVPNIPETVDYVRRIMSNLPGIANR